MDSELDCDKMDYLLRDSMFCGVEYGKYDIERLISSLTVYKRDGMPRLAIDSGGIQVFEEFVLARYFMFIQVYFHRTRRYFDIMFFNALKSILPNGKYPEATEEYLMWDDYKVIQCMKEHVGEIEACSNIINRRVYPCVHETKTHPESGDKNEFKMATQSLKAAFGSSNFLEDYSADKMPHKIPIKSEITGEKEIIIIHKNTGKLTTISEESHIIRALTDKIDIQRLYVKPELRDGVRQYIQQIYHDIQNS